MTLDIQEDFPKILRSKTFIFNLSIITSVVVDRI